MTITPDDNRPPSEVTSMVKAAHREVDELLKLGVLTSGRADKIKHLLTSKAIEQHDRDGMRLSEIVDLYRDLTAPG